MDEPEICATCGLPVAANETWDGVAHLTRSDCMAALRATVARLRQENKRLWALAEAVRELYTDTPKAELERQVKDTIRP